MRTFLAGLFLAMTALPAAAAELTLDRLFASPALSGPVPRRVKLSPDGRFATLLRARAGDLARYDLWAIDTRSGATRMLVDSLKVGSGRGGVGRGEDAARARAYRRHHRHRHL